MGRLIDADRLKSIHEINKANFNTITGIREWIDNQPTAYDTEKVVEQIENMHGVDAMYYGSEVKWAVDKAIELVRKGGAE